MGLPDYDEMLARARKKIPKGVLEKSVFEIPKVTTTHQGSKTIITNFSEIADLLNRQEAHLMKFLNKELATAGVKEGRRLVLQGRFSNSVLNSKIELYVKSFVLCPQCGRHDTKLEREGRVWILKCMACGAKEPVKGV